MANIKVGDKVTCSAEYDWDGTHLCDWVREGYIFDVIQIGGRTLPENRVVIGIGSDVTAAVDMKYLSPVNPPKQSPPTPVVKAKNEDNSKKDNVDIDALLGKIGGNGDNGLLSYTTTGINGSAVQYMNKKYGSTEVGEKNYNVPVGAPIKTPKEVLDVERREPASVQNSAKFPHVIGFDNNVGYYRYNYYMDYESDLSTHASDMDAIRRSINTDIDTRRKLYLNNTSKYNRYKIDNPNDYLMHTFSHVFFVRPDCNIFKPGSGSAPTPELVKTMTKYGDWYFALKNCPELLRQLTQSEAGYNHEFMMFPSNKSRSFDLKDEYIGTDTYGSGLTGYTVSYGKGKAESRTSGTFDISYIDDPDLHIYKLHKYWTDYIAGVYSGEFYPKDEYVLNKIIDYTTCVYYILCGEDGETILFWSKYWGVFPHESPSASLSYSSETAGGSGGDKNSLKISYSYAWKEDFNPLSLIEFNKHSPEGDYKYIKSYQESKIGTGYTWAGAPFIETFNGYGDLPYTFKLRFRPE